MAYIIEGWKDSDVPVELEVKETESEAIRWAEMYIKSENAGGYDSVTVHQIPFVDDYVWSWDK